jgi:hypothetical protein
VLQQWTVPDTDLGFEMVRRAIPVARPAKARWWGLSPAWGLAAAAMLVGAVSAAIAQVEVTVGSGGVTVRTGWASAPVQTAQAAPSGELERISARLADLEQELSGRPAPQVVAASTTSAPAQVPGVMSEAQLVQMLRKMIEASEERQQGVLARQILQINRDLASLQRSDVDRLGRVTEQLQRTTLETYQRQRALEEHVMRVGLQR